MNRPKARIIINHSAGYQEIDLSCCLPVASMAATASTCRRGRRCPRQHGWAASAATQPPACASSAMPELPFLKLLSSWPDSFPLTVLSWPASFPSFPYTIYFPVPLSFQVNFLSLHYFLFCLTSSHYTIFFPVLFPFLAPFSFLSSITFPHTVFFPGHLPFIKLFSFWPVFFPETFPILSRVFFLASFLCLDHFRSYRFLSLHISFAILLPFLTPFPF
jgi:hypothetical protein